MSGLDKMKAQIIAEAQENAKEILAQAHAQADSIIGEAKAQAEKDARKIVAQAEARAEDSVKRLASSSDMRKRKAVLEAKQEVISEVLEDAYKAVGELDDAAYFTETVPDGMDGGFILIYGGIEENCTIKALFDAKRDELSDKVNRQLFTAV